jgi:hypothetical protein
MKINLKNTSTFIAATGVFLSGAAIPAIAGIELIGTESSAESASAARGLPAVVPISPLSAVLTGGVGNFSQPLTPLLDPGAFNRFPLSAAVEAAPAAAAPAVEIIAPQPLAAAAAEAETLSGTAPLGAAASPAGEVAPKALNVLTQALDSEPSFDSLRRSFDSAGSRSDGDFVKGQGAAPAAAVPFSAARNQYERAMEFLAMKALESYGVESVVYSIHRHLHQKTYSFLHVRFKTLEDFVRWAKEGPKSIKTAMDNKQIVADADQSKRADEYLAMKALESYGVESVVYTIRWHLHQKTYSFLSARFKTPEDYLRWVKDGPKSIMNAFGYEIRIVGT